MIDRRQLLATVGSAVAAPMAEAGRGAGTIRVVSDGHMNVGIDRLVAAADEPATRQVLAANGISAPVRFGLNVAFPRYPGKNVLIDAGAGGRWVDTAGKLVDNLRNIAVGPTDIELVVFTHAHPDHLWGAIDDFDDSLRFPNADYVIPDREFLFWMTPGEAERLGAADGVIVGARRILKRLEPKLKRVKAGAEILPGLAYLDAAGHTPGQCAVVFQESPTESWLIAADTIFHPIISVEYPDWQPAQDMDGARAAKSRRDLLAFAADNRAAISAYHVATPGLGRIKRRGDAYLWRDA